MANVKLGGKTYEGVTAVKTDTTDGGTAEFAPYDETFAAGKAEGIEEGYANGKTDGIAEGIQAEYDRFWDAAQDFGKRRLYLRAFASELWTDENFKPKYDLICSGPTQNMFYYSQITDLTGILERQNVVMDTSAATGLYAAFHSSKITRIPEISLLGITPGSNGAEAVFPYATGLTEISRIILPDEYRFELKETFTQTTSLRTVNFEGVIGCDINFKHSPLSATSINSVITHLSGTATGKTATFMRSAVNKAFETAEGSADGSSSQAWLDLIATKPNWTISLA